MILLYKSITILLNIVETLIVVRILLSFLNLNNPNIITKFVYEMTEPVLGPARNLIQKLGIKTGMIDFSPLLAILFLRIVYDMIVRILF